MSETSSNPRAFTIDTARFGQHQLTMVSLEPRDEYFHDSAVFPPDRLGRTLEVMEKSDLTVVEYFPPELEQNAYRMPVIGPLAKKLIRPSDDYNYIESFGFANGLRMGSADIANRPAFLLYGILGGLVMEYALGLHRVEPYQDENIIPTPAEARRLLTAAAIVQECRRHPEGIHVTYIAAPAHVNRVREKIQQAPNEQDIRRLGLYTRLPFLDAVLRIYEPHGNLWRLTEQYQIAPEMGAL